MAAWASVALPNTEMLIATQCENHLFPLMERIARRFETTPELRQGLEHSKRTPSWSFRFNNGFVLWGRIAGPRGVNFQGLHVDWQLVDEAQEMTESSWAELYQALNADGFRWVYGVPNGLRGGFYRMTQDRSVNFYNWPSTLNPDYDDVKDAELARLYGGKDSPGYVHRVLGQHGQPAHGVFDLDDYAACVDEALEFVNIELIGEERLELEKKLGRADYDDEHAHEHEQEHGDVHVHENTGVGPLGVQRGDYYLGCDLGYARDPSEFVVYRAEGPHLINVARVHLRGVHYARQIGIIAELDRAYDFRVVAIDAGNNGRAVAHQLMARGEEWRQKVVPVEFGGTLDVASALDDSPVRVHAKEFMTRLIQDRLHERTIVLPRLPEREVQYANHAYALGAHGRIVYQKGDDHLIDADRCAMYAHWVDTRVEEYVDLGVRVEGFW